MVVIRHAVVDWLLPTQTKSDVSCPQDAALISMSADDDTKAVLLVCFGNKCFNPFVCFCYRSVHRIFNPAPIMQKALPIVEVIGLALDVLGRSHRVEWRYHTALFLHASFDSPSELLDAIRF